MVIADTTAKLCIRSLIRLCSMAVLITLSQGAAAQDAASSYPTKVVRLVANSLAGGMGDVVGRVVAERLAASPGMNGQQVIVDNRTGGGGVVAAQYTINSAADGYTVLLADLGITAIVPALGEKPAYDTLRDFVPVSEIATTPFFLAVHSSLGVSTLKEFIALAKAKPGKLFYGSSGLGTVHHLATEALKTSLGLDIVHVPYKSSGQSTPALIAGDVQVLFTALGPIRGHVKEGKVRLLAVASPKRTPQAPEVPAFPELGVKDVLALPSLHALVPAGTPPAIVAKLSAEFRKALQQPEAVKRLEALGIEPVGSTPEQSVAQITEDRAFYKRAIELSGVKATAN